MYFFIMINFQYKFTFILSLQYKCWFFYQDSVLEMIWNHGELSLAKDQSLCARHETILIGIVLMKWLEKCLRIDKIIRKETA